MGEGAMIDRMETYINDVGMGQFLSEVAEICELKSIDASDAGRYEDAEIWIELTHEITKVENQFFGD